jgi:redox-sensitive bicupin YhaK (pirin superfamily)
MAARGETGTGTVKLGVRRADERGHVDHGWLDTRHTFSFAAYNDPEWMGFRALRVINDDRIAPGRGFAKHPHRNMEIVTVVLSGSLEHRDNMGNGSVIVPGEVQKMSAGNGVIHSEANASYREPLHLLQIWIEPDELEVEPSYDQRTFPEAERRGRLRTVLSPDGADGSIPTHADARILATLLASGEQVIHVVPPGRGAWVHVARGRLEANGVALSGGDGAWTNEAGEIRLVGVEAAEALVFDLA